MKHYQGFARQFVWVALLHLYSCNYYTISTLFVSRSQKQIEKEALRRAGNQAVWITPTHERADELNAIETERPISSGAVYLRSVCYHATADKTGSKPKIVRDLTVSANLMKNSKQKYLRRNGDILDTDQHLPATDITYAVGMRVACTMNEGTQVGVYNGATGVVVGFAFKNGDRPQPSCLERKGALDKVSCSIVANPKNRPLILVQMDETEVNHDISCLSKDDRTPFNDTRRIIPFS